MIPATETKPGKIYRRGRNGCGTYYMRPKQSAGAWVRALTKRGRNIWCWQDSYLMRYKEDPNMVLLVRAVRGKSQEGVRYEYKRKILVPADMRLREVKARPGYH